MTDSEICRMYRQAKDKGTQIQILAELNATSRDAIIKILLTNGEQVKLPLPRRGKRRNKELTDKQYYNALLRRLDVLDVQIAKAEGEYRMILAVLEGAKNA